MFECVVFGNETVKLNIKDATITLQIFLQFGRGLHLDELSGRHRELLCDKLIRISGCQIIGRDVLERLPGPVKRCMSESSLKSSVNELILVRSELQRVDHVIISLMLPASLLVTLICVITSVPAILPHIGGLSDKDVMYPSVVLDMFLNVCHDDLDVRDTVVQFGLCELCEAVPDHPVV